MLFKKDEVRFPLPDAGDSFFEGGEPVKESILSTYKCTAEKKIRSR